MDNLFQELLELIFIHLTHANYKSIIGVCRLFYVVAHNVHPDAHIKFANTLFTILRKDPSKVAAIRKRGNIYGDYAQGALSLGHLMETIGFGNGDYHMPHELYSQYRIKPSYMDYIVELFGTDMTMPSDLRTEQNMRKYPEIKWYVSHYSNDCEVSLEFIDTHPYLPWSWYQISRREDLTLEFVRKNKDKLYVRLLRVVDMDDIIANDPHPSTYVKYGKISIDHVYYLATIDGNAEALLSNVNIPIDIRMDLYANTDLDLTSALKGLRYDEIARHSRLYYLVRSGKDGGFWASHASVEDLENHWDEIGDKSGVHMNRSLTLGFVRKYIQPDEIMHWYCSGEPIVGTKTIILDIARANPDCPLSDIIINQYVQYDYVDWNTICKHDIDWDWNTLSMYIDYNIIMANPDRPWNMDLVARNPTRPWTLYVNYKFEPAIV